MKRKRNINFGFFPAHPTRADLVKSRREFKAGVRQKVKEMRAEYSRLRKSARSGRTQSTRKLEQLFHEVYGPQENPRILPEMNEQQLAAIEKLIRGKAMAQKKRKKKRKNPRKGRMPAGLKAYWAKKRRAKNSRRRNSLKGRLRKLRSATIGKAKHRGYTKWTTPRRGIQVFKDGRRPKSAAEKEMWLREMGTMRNPKRRRKSNPRPRKAQRINLKGFTSSQIKRVASAIRRATGKRVRIVRS
jgi:hypothetical protein